MHFYRTLQFIAVFFLFSAFASAQQATPVPQPEMTAEKWREDLRFFTSEMERTHKNAFNAVSREQFQAAVEELDKQIPTLEGHQIVAGLMRLTAMIGDGHTGFRWGPMAAEGVLPVGFYWFEDGIFVRRVAPSESEILGAKLVEVGGVPVDSAIERLKPMIWRDNEMGVKSAAPIYLSVPRILHAAGLSTAKNAGTFTFEKDGKRFTKTLSPAAKLADLWSKPEGWIDAMAAAGTRPLFAREPQNRFWFTIAPESKTLYVQFNEVLDKPEETVADFFARVFKEAEDKPVERLVLDMRLNGGGNNYLNIPIITGAIRSRLNVKGKFFVIIGRETFSAAQNTVNDLEKYTNAIFVGEPTGASPNHFGDARRFTLPNSKFQVQASTLWWQDMDPRDERKWKAPDVAADMAFSDYRAGRDPAMEAILKYTPTESMADIIAATRTTGNVADFIARYRRFRTNPLHKYAETLTTVNRVGHFLLGQKRTDDALTIFKINAEDNPGSAIVYQSLGDVYDIKGEKALALENYRKAVAIDQSLSEAKLAIRRLSAELGDKNN